MNTTYTLYTRPRRHWFIAMSVGVHMVALGLLVWWLVPDPVMQPANEPATLSVTLAPASNEPVPAVTQLQPTRTEAVAAVGTVVEQAPSLAQDVQVTPVAADPVRTETLAAKTHTDLYHQLLLSSRAQMARDFALSILDATQQLTALLNAPLADGTLVGRLQSERNWAGTEETLLVFDTTFGTLCSSYTEADPLDSLDRGMWRVMFGGCYQGH